jgi:hypothetical protein
VDFGRYKAGPPDQKTGRHYQIGTPGIAHLAGMGIFLLVLVTAFIVLAFIAAVAAGRAQAAKDEELRVLWSAAVRRRAADVGRQTKSGALDPAVAHKTTTG